MMRHSPRPRKQTNERGPQQVAAQLADEGLLADGTTLVFHAGKDYYAELRPLIEDTTVTVEIPIEGLQIGDTLAWYNEHQ